MDIDEFKAAFGQILGKGKNEQQMAIMFMKIDTNCDGTVDWVSEREEGRKGEGERVRERERGIN